MVTSLIHAGFQTWNPDRQYDLVLWLHVREHIHEPVGEKKLPKWMG